MLRGLLQLSRGIDAAETLRAAVSAVKLHSWLQLSRGIDAAETFVAAELVEEQTLASIEPRHRRRGNPLETSDVNPPRDLLQLSRGIDAAETKFEVKIETQEDTGFN